MRTNAEGGGGVGKTWLLGMIKSLGMTKSWEMTTSLGMTKSAGILLHSPGTSPSPCRFLQWPGADSEPESAAPGGV